MHKHELQGMTPVLATHLVREAEGMRRREIESLQRDRLAFLLSYARKLSPLLAEKYSGLPRDSELTDIPTTTHEEAAGRFEEWVCDRNLTREGTLAFADGPGADGYHLDRYRVYVFPADAGARRVMVRDDRHTMINAALMASRFFGGQKLGGIKRLTEHGCRCCGVLENTGFHLAYLAFMRAKHGMNPPDDSLLVLTPDQPLDERIDRLNDFRPELFFGTPSLLESYAPIQQDGKLQISPLAICTSDEHLVEKTLRSLENTFGCPVMNGYCIPEAGEVAMLCRENRLHVNDDWFIIEPVDAANRPVKDGKLSNGVLVTNLANLAQPLIRFRLPDRVTLHRESCACGSAFPFLGRFER